MIDFIQFLFNGFAKGAIYGLVALGFSLIYNEAKVLHIAHASVYTITAYLLFTTYSLLHFPLLLAISISLIGAIFLGILMELLVYKPLYRKKAPLATSFVSSLGLYLLLQNLVPLIWGNQFQVLTNIPDITYSIAGIMVGRIQLLELGIAFFIMLIFLLFLSFTKLGKSLKALANNPVLTEVIGMNIGAMRLFVFAVGSFLAGVAAVLYSFDIGLDPSMGMPIILTSLVAVIVGGTFTFEGAFLGGICVGLLQALTIWKFSTKWDTALLFIALTLFLLFRPQGILGVKKRAEEITR
jgi:branched-chain amino acid transport system permease protein